MRVDIHELAHDAVTEYVLGVIGDRRIEQRAEILVQLAGDEVQLFEQLVAFGTVAGWRQILAGHLVGDHLHDHGAFGHELAAIEGERGFRDLNAPAWNSQD